MTEISDLINHIEVVGSGNLKFLKMLLDYNNYYSDYSEAKEIYNRKNNEDDENNFNDDEENDNYEDDYQNRNYEESNTIINNSNLNINSGGFSDSNTII